MLILTRKAGEKICINDNEIVLTVLGVQDSSVRLGFDAPINVIINREEVHRKIQKSKDSENSDTDQKSEISSDSK